MEALRPWSQVAAAYTQFVAVHQVVSYILFCDLCQLRQAVTPILRLQQAVTTSNAVIKVGDLVVMRQ